MFYSLFYLLYLSQPTPSVIQLILMVLMTLIMPKIDHMAHMIWGFPLGNQDHESERDASLLDLYGLMVIDKGSNNVWGSTGALTLVSLLVSYMLFQQWWIFASQKLWLLCGFMQMSRCRLHGPLRQQMIELSDEHNSASFYLRHRAPFACRKENAKFLQRGINFSARGAISEI